MSGDQARRAARRAAVLVASVTLVATVGQAPAGASPDASSFFGDLVTGPGQPVVGATVALTASDGTVVASAVTDTNGDFSVDAPPAQYGIDIVEADGPTVLEADSEFFPGVDLTSGGMGEEIDLPLPATLDVTVVSAGNPVAGASVSEPSGHPLALLDDNQFIVRRVGGSIPSTCTTDPTGQCTLPTFLGSSTELNVSVVGYPIVTAFDDFVVSDPSATTVAVTPIPSAPTIESATAGDASASVAFDAPVSAGQSPISGYTAACLMRGQVFPTSASGASSPIVVTGLTNGDVYSCTVTASNSFGASVPSAPSNSIMPVTLPTALFIPRIFPEREAALVLYGGDGGGLPILDTTVTCSSIDGASTGTATSTTGQAVVEGLTAGDTYACTASVRTALGSSPPSPASTAFMPLPPPTVTRLSRAFGPAEGGTTINIVGTGLADVGTVVMFGTTRATELTTNATGTSITVSAPTETAGTVDLTVVDATSTSAPTPGDRYTFLGPTVTRLGRITGPGGGGTHVTIYGRDLNGATEVAFGSIAAAAFTINNAGTMITATTPPESAGTVDITVTTPGGTSPPTTHDRFTFRAPSVNRVTPSTGATAGGTTVTISGINFGGATAVSFGGIAAPSYIVNAAGTSITATTPSGPPGTIDITITTPGGTSPPARQDHYTYT